MRKLFVVAVLVLAGCGGDDGGGGDDDGTNDAPPGVRDGSGWETTFGYKVSGLLGTDGVRQIYPLSMAAYAGTGVQLLYGEDAMGQQGTIGERKGFTFGSPTSQPIPFDAGVPYPGNQTADDITYFWSEFGEPIAFRIYQDFGQPARHVEFVKQGTTIYSGDPHHDAYGRGTIGADGAFYAYGTLTYRAETASSQWANAGCYPVNGVPPVNQVGDAIWDVEATDPSRLLQLSTQGETIKLWRNDPDAARDPGVNLPTCGPVTLLDTGEQIQRAFLRTIGGVVKVVAHTDTKILVYVWADNALTLEAQATLSPAPPQFTFGGRKDLMDIATDGTDLWVAFLDSTQDKRVTVMVQRGSTFETVGEPGFSNTLYTTMPVLGTLESGGVLVSYGSFETYDTGDGYGSMWIAAPE